MVFAPEQRRKLELVAAHRKARLVAASELAPGAWLAVMEKPAP